MGGWIRDQIGDPVVLDVESDVALDDFGRGIDMVLVWY